MKITIILAVSFLFSTITYSQIDIFDKIKEKVEQKADQKTDEAIDNGLDEVEKDITKDREEEEEMQNEEEQENNENEESVNEVKVKQDKKAGLKSYSKYDFIAGEKTVFFDDFNQDNLGDFPLKWNTNSGGEVVELEGLGKWFVMNWGGTFYPEMSAQLPENFTIEFDLIYDLGENTNPPNVNLDIISTLPNEPMDNLVPGNGGTRVSFGTTRVSYHNWMNQEYAEISNQKETDLLEIKSGEIVRISIMIQKQRMRVWMDENKVIDIPRMMPAGLIYDRLRFSQWGEEHETIKFFIKNFRVAAGVPDMRSKLITEGRLVTHGIYFDSGSDKIKPESYGTLKGIAAVLSENPDVKVNIVGHTDSDGSDVSNLELSKKRSQSVKKALSGEFGIDESRIETDGKGEVQPMDVNTTAEGKANNRRVEFIKL